MHSLLKGPGVRIAMLLAASGSFCALCLPAKAQLYTSYVFQGTSNGNTPLRFTGTNFVGVVDAPLPLTGLTPNYHFNNAKEVYANPTNGVTTTFTASAAAASRGNWTSGMSDFGAVTNGYNPGPSNVGTTNPPFGYYVQSTFGSATQVTFLSPTSPVTFAQAHMHWSVSGTSNTTLGTALPRIDFAVTTNPVDSVFDIFDKSVVANPMEGFGFGKYSYDVPISIGQAQNFLFWSSTFWEVDPADLPGTPQDFSGQIDATHTFDLSSIDLVDQNGDPISQWSLVDTKSGVTLWNQNGRVAAVPEPGSIGMMAGAFLTGLGIFSRSLKRRQQI